MPLEAQSTTGSLDPQAVNLAKAIRQVESNGNPQAVGKSGELGAYQFTPDTWNLEAPKYGVNVPIQQASLEQQNQVAYGRIKKWKDEGKNVGQIASMWNAGVGEPDAYTGEFSSGTPAMGTNSLGAQYDVPGYAQKVAQTYQSLKGQTPQPQQTQQTTEQPKQFDYWNDKTPGQLLSWADLDKAALGTLAVAGTVATAGASGALGWLGSLFGLGNAATTGSGMINKALDTAKTYGKGYLLNQGVQGAENLLGINQSQSGDIQSGVQSSDELSKNIAQMVMGTPTGRTFMQDPKNQEVIQTMGMYGVHPGNGQYADFSSSIGNLQEALGHLATGEKEILKTEGASAPLSDVIHEAKQVIASNRLMTPQEKAEAYGHIENEAKSYGKSLGLHEMVDARHQQYAAGERAFREGKTSAKKEAHAALGLGFRNTVSKHTKHKELFNHVLKEESKIKRAQKLAQKLNGKKLPMQAKGTGHQVGRFLARYAADYLGAKIGGPFGAIVGDILGQRFLSAMDKKYAKTIFETPAGHKALEQIQRMRPQAYRALIVKLQQAGIKIPEFKHEGLIKLPKKEEKKRDALLRKERAKGAKIREQDIRSAKIPFTSKSEVQAQSPSQRPPFRT